VRTGFVQGGEVSGAEVKMSEKLLYAEALKETMAHALVASQSATEGLSNEDARKDEDI